MRKTVDRSNVFRAVMPGVPGMMKVERMTNEEE